MVDSVISGVSIVNSAAFQLQILGTARTIQVETTDSGQIFLSKDCLDAEILTAKCSAIVISFPEGEEFVEKPLPEMFRSVIQNGTVVSTIVEHKG